jgi:hypothetical protein
MKKNVNKKLTNQEEEGTHLKLIKSFSQPRTSQINNRSLSNHSSHRLIAKAIIIISILCIILLGCLTATAYGLYRTYTTLHNLKKEPISRRDECKSGVCYQAANFMLSIFFSL